MLLASKVATKKSTSDQNKEKCAVIDVFLISTGLRFFFKKSLNQCTVHSNRGQCLSKAYSLQKGVGEGPDA